MIKPELLAILCCPETHQALAAASATQVEALNKAIASGKCRNRGGQPITEKIDGGLVRDDQKFIYPVRGDIPIMLIDEAIPLVAV